jgi:hypothetical protein
VRPHLDVSENIPPTWHFELGMWSLSAGFGAILFSDKCGNGLGFLALFVGYLMWSPYLANLMLLSAYLVLFPDPFLAASLFGQLFNAAKAAGKLRWAMDRLRRSGAEGCNMKLM